MSTAETDPSRKHAYTESGIPQLPEPTYAERVRTLVSLCTLATLSTVSRKHPGYPFGSLMPYAIDDAGRPIFLISSMAMHTQNMQADPRASLFVCQGGDGDPLGTARATLVGDVLPIPEVKSARLANAICRATRIAARGWTSKTLAFTACNRWTFTMSAALG